MTSATFVGVGVGVEGVVDFVGVGVGVGVDGVVDFVGLSDS